VARPSDPGRWAEAAGAWDELSCPWPTAYTRWRLAEALLERGVPREEAAEALRQAWATAHRLGASPLLGEVELLARRARIAVAPEPVAAAASSPAAQPAAPGDRLGLTPREREVLAWGQEGYPEECQGKRRDPGTAQPLVEEDSRQHNGHDDGCVRGRGGNGDPVTDLAPFDPSRFQA